MKKVLLVVTLCMAWGIQAQTLERIEDGPESAYVYTDGKFEIGSNEFFLETASIAPDAETLAQAVDDIGNRILPERVRKVLKAEMEKAPEERGGFMAHAVFDAQGKAYSATFDVWGDLCDKITEKDLEEIYRNLMQEKVEPKENPNRPSSMKPVKYYHILLAYVCEMFHIPWSQVDM